MSEAGFGYVARVACENCAWEATAEADDIAALRSNVDAVLGSHVCPMTCGHDSATGVDQDFGPDKVWRCDACGWLYRTVTEDGITRRVPGREGRV